MKNYARSFLAFLIWPFLAMALASGCGGRKESEGLTADVRPSSAMISKGPDSSCLDKANFYRALNTDPAGVTQARSLIGPMIKFQTFKMKWESIDPLTIQGVRFKISGAGIQDDVYETSLAPDEVEALLAVPESIVNNKTHSPVTTIDTSDGSRYNPSSKLTYAPCSLAVGGIPLKDGDKTPPFTATVVIEIIGSATDYDSNQRFVRTRIRTRAQFYGI